MNQQEALSVIIGRTVAIFPANVAYLLQKNAVVLDAQNYNISELVDAVVGGLSSSESFKNDFISFVEVNKDII
jgi:hypothetical protein